MTLCASCVESKLGRSPSGIGEAGKNKRFRRTRNGAKLSIETAELEIEAEMIVIKHILIIGCLDIVIVLICS